ncbi:MAG: MFS transporter [Bacteroidales bacterium]|nr:MFS transporter [Bacteroidales bacterium]OJX91625.1 MAG: MFS transporter [Paludibacter sp. 47-17]
MKKPRLSFFQILSMSMGFMGIQFGFALQNSNASRILQTFGADMEHLSWFWLAAPLTGLVIQPVIGHYSDKTWTGLGRRRPFFLAGALLAAAALLLMPNAGEFAHYLPPMFVGAGFLMIMDASINVAMEPFRALVGDMLPDEQTTVGFSVQTFLIGVGAVAGSWLPYVLAEWFGISKVAPEGAIPDNVVFSFYIGAAVLVLAILWTVVTTREYSPEQLNIPHEEESHPSGFSGILRDITHMPVTMKQLGLVQFFSWIALFGMWVFTTPAIAQHVYGVAADDTASVAYQDAGNWVGILFGVYNGVAMVYALLLPSIARLIGRKGTHAVSLIAGGVGLIAIYFISDPTALIYPMIGIGLAWGSILAMPYAILAPALPARKMGIYMGIFNIFITLPQIVNGVFGGPVVKRIFDSQAIYALLMSGVFLLIAAASVLFVDDKVKK